MALQGPTRSSVFRRTRRRAAIAALLALSFASLPSPDSFLSRFAFVASAHAKRPRKAAPPARKQAAPKQAATEPAAAVSTVNGEAISQSEFDVIVAQALAQESASKAKDGPALTPEQRLEIKKGVLRTLIGRKLLLQHAIKQGYKSTEAEVDEAIASIKKDVFNGSEVDFRAQLQKDRMTLPELRVNLRDSLVLSKLKKHVFDGASATPEEVSSVYEANKQVLSRPESVKARNIYIKTATGATPEQESASKARINAAMDEARKGGDFAAVARKYSEAGNAAQGGDMGTITRDTPLMPQMIQTLFATPPGQVSEPFRTEIGWHVVKVEEKIPPHQLTLEEAREPITRSIRLRKTEREMAMMAAGLWREGKVTSKIAVTPEPPKAGGAPARPSP